MVAKKSQITNEWIARKIDILMIYSTSKFILTVSSYPSVLLVTGLLSMSKSIEQEAGPADERPPRKGIPRRPTQESLTYLASLEPLINKTLASSQSDTVQDDGNDAAEDAEDAALLVNNLIEELVFQVRRMMIIMMMVGFLATFATSTCS